ncbi:MAG: GGDEF domain-containing protein [bacterium]
MSLIENLEPRHQISRYPPTAYDIVLLFFEAVFSPLSYNVFSNVYTLFGMAWGITVPIGVFTFEYLLTGQTPTLILHSNPTHMLLFLHPFLFGGIFGILGTIHYKIIQDLQERSVVDELTGLYNFRYFRSELSHRVKEIERYGDTPFCLLLLDIDHFKNVNDTHGHQKGDEVLKAIGEILRDVTRDADIVCRYGGEEFSIIMPETGKKEGYNLAERIRESIEDHDFGIEGNLTISGGLAEYPIDADYDDGLINVADEHLYEAKESGRNQVVPTA